MNASDITFEVVYHLIAQTKEIAASTAERIRVEQSVEMPLSALPTQAECSLPNIQSVKQQTETRWEVTLSFPYNIIGEDIIQFLNVLYGNISLYNNIKIVDVSSNILQRLFDGPTFGIEGIRKLLHVYNRPLSCTALKPVGLSPSQFAERAYNFSLGGIDIIKDDHGLANQDSADFQQRISACIQAIKKANDKSGSKTLYFPNITAGTEQLKRNFDLAIEKGADGVLISPQLTGLSTLKDLSSQKVCPIMAHPAFSGSFISQPDSGFSLQLYYGKLWRALGADAVIFPNTGGRFPFSYNQCQSLHNTLTSKIKTFKTSFPVPAGGIQLDSIDKWIKEYGLQTIFLIGGSLYTQPGGILDASKTFKSILINHGSSIKSN